MPRSGAAIAAMTPRSGINISPFALDFSFKRGTLGALFFNPAKRYADRLKIAEPWSREYVNYPFAR